MIMYVIVMIIKFSRTSGPRAVSRDEKAPRQIFSRGVRGHVHPDFIFEGAIWRILWVFFLQNACFKYNDFFIEII